MNDDVNTFELNGVAIFGSSARVLAAYTVHIHHLNSQGELRPQPNP
jgi:hypothetical protein